MKSDAVKIVGIDPFDDVDLTTGRPIGTEGPEGWPDAANPSRHVCNVGDEEAVCVGLLRGDSNRSAASRRIDCGRINSQVDGVATISSKTTGIGNSIGGELDETVRGVCTAEEVELVEEVCMIERISDGVVGICDAGSAKK